MEHHGKGIDFVVLADDKRLRAEGIPLWLSPGGPVLLRDDLSWQYIDRVKYGIHKR